MAKFRENILFIIFTSVFMMLMVIPMIYIVILITGQITIEDNTIYQNTVLASISIMSIGVVSLWALLKLQPENADKPSPTDNPSMAPDFNSGIEVREAIRQQHLQDKNKTTNAIFAAIQQYIEITLSPYLKESSLAILYNNVYLWHHDKSEPLPSIETDGQLTTLDLRHLAWNIGERTGWTGEERALFIKQCFPSVLKDIEVESIRRNLRQKGKGKICLDVPDEDSFAFHYKQENLHNISETMLIS